MINIRGKLDEANEYAAEHEAPDWDALIGNPTVRQRVAYVRKQISDVLNVVATTGVVALVPEPANYYVAGGVALLGWFVHYKVPNGPKPPVNDPTGWVDSPKPAPSDERPPTEDVDVTVTPDVEEPDE